MAKEISPLEYLKKREEKKRAEPKDIDLERFKKRLEEKIKKGFMNRSSFDSLVNDYKEKRGVLLKKTEKPAYFRTDDGKLRSTQPAQVIPGIKKLSEREKEVLGKEEKTEEKKQKTAEEEQKETKFKTQLDEAEERELKERQKLDKLRIKAEKRELKEQRKLDKLEEKVKKKRLKGELKGTKGERQTTGRLMFIFAILLWGLDMWIGFSGIQYERFLNIFRDSSSFLNFFRIGWNVVTLILIVTIIWSKLFGISDNRELLARLLMFETYNIILTLGGFNLGLVAHLTFAFFFCFAILVPYYEYKGNKIMAYWYTIGFIIIDFFLFPFIGYYYTGASDVRGAFPVWILITLTYALKLKRGRLLGIFSFGFIMFYLFAFAQPLFGGLDVGLAGMQAGEQGFEAIKEVGTKFVTNVKDSIQKTADSAEKKFNESIAYATGDYYKSMVDHNVEEPLGVYITNIETADPEVYEDEEIEIWANLRAKSIEEPIDLITVNCSANKGTTKEKIGELKVTEFRDFIDEEGNLDCKFEEGILEAGSHIITFTAEFDFTTLVYLKTYFIDNNRLKALRREGIDVFDEYGIRDKDPIAIYTNGPVGIGMETKTPPIGISEDYDSTPKLGITIENKGLGLIREIEDLIIYLPEGIELEDNCDDAFESLETGEYMLEGHNAYQLVEEVKDSKKYWKDIESYRSINCRLSITDVGRVLGETPFATKYIKARIKYIYNSEESISINVKTPKGFNVYFESKKPPSNKDLTCWASHSDLYVIRAPFEIYKNDAEEPFTKETKECGTKSYKCDFIIPHSEFERGDTIKCKVFKAELSHDIEETDSAVVTIQNAAPTIEVNLTPENPTIDDNELKCIATIKDEENDECWVNYEVKVNNKKLSYDHLDIGWIKDNEQFQILINLEKLKNDGELKEKDKISCEMTAIDDPGPDFEREESEPDKDIETITKPPETSTTGTGGTSDVCAGLNADCGNPSNPKNNGRACGCNHYKNCYEGQCIPACEFLVKTGDNRVGSNWGCACNMEIWTKQECEASDKCIVGYCPGNYYCCSPEAAASV